MIIEEGYFYHIKDHFFSDVNDEHLMSNKENGKYRPHFFAVRDADNEKIMWLIPVSSQVDKYKAIQERQIKKYGRCTKIILGRCDGRQAAFLIQNAFPITSEYFDHIHTSNGEPLKLHSSTRRLIVEYLYTNLGLHKRGVKIFFADIDRIYDIMEDSTRPVCLAIQEMERICFRKGVIIGFIKGIKDFEPSKEIVTDILMEEFSLDRNAAEDYIRQYWD